VNVYELGFESAVKKHEGVLNIKGKQLKTLFSCSVAG
jgi:hypothetical protein